MRIEAKTRIKDAVNGVAYNLSLGDVMTVPDECAYWVSNGWAKNVETGEEHEPAKRPVTLNVHSVSHATKVEVK